MMYTARMGKGSLSNRDVCRIAAESDVDHRTVERFLRGKVAHRNSRARGRIIQAMRNLGYADDIPYPGPAKA